ncbi:protein phosphatase PTC7 homolog [Drosophila madeirensis]|uniref:Protein phosphatase n=1 Tax=Drosophila madeirensis TaxID=30013 RepID=A0AAU9G225_DROMD
MLRFGPQNMDRLVRLPAGIQRVETHLLTAASAGRHIIKIVLRGSGLLVQILISHTGKVLDVVIERSARVVYRARLSLAQLAARGTHLFQQTSIWGDELVARITADGEYLLEQAKARGTQVYRRASTNGGRMIARLGQSTSQLVHVLSTGGLRLVTRATSGGCQCLSLIGGGGVRLLKPLFEGYGWLRTLLEEYEKQVADAELRPQPKDIHGWKLYGPKELRLLSVTCGIPRKRAECQVLGQCGEDAWFAASTNRGDTLGVADGVGCGRISKLSPGEFSSSLMRSCERLALSPCHEPRRLDLLLHRAHREVQEERHPVLAGCHTCLLSLDRRTGTVSATNIGSCGFLVVRKGTIVARSTKQTRNSIASFRGGSAAILYDVIAQPSIQQFRAEAGDMLLLATDGFFDNVNDERVLSLISELDGRTEPCRMRLYAETLALMARAATCSTYRKGWNRQLKMDDITVVLAVVN